MITVTNKKNERYSTELKATLYSWRKKARIQGNATPGTKKMSKNGQVKINF